MGIDHFTDHNIRVRMGRGMKAFLSSHAVTIIALIPAAAGGILSSWFRGNPAKPRLVVMVGRNQVRPNPPVFIHT
jgi:hypothetical protein